MEFKSFDDWQIEYFSTLEKKIKLTTNEKMILDLYNQKSKTSIIKKTLNTLLKTRYNEYKRDFEYQTEREKLKAYEQAILEKLKKFKTHQNIKNRKKREHELITIGALTDLVKFPKDRGIITGAFLYVLDKVKENPNFEHQLKIRGDELLREREIEKKQKNPTSQTE